MADRSIVALILTHNAPESLRRCLEAIAGQSSPPEAVLVVDNASNPPVEPVGWPTPRPTVTIVRSEVNTGPAGGYTRGIRGVPRIGLQPRMGPRRRHATRSALPRAPVGRGRASTRVGIRLSGLAADGRLLRGVAVLVRLPRLAPDRRHGRCAEGGAVLVGGGHRVPPVADSGRRLRATVSSSTRSSYHDAVRQNDTVPLWKYYYEARNMLWVHLHVKRRVGRYPRSVSKLVARALWREGAGRTQRAAVIARGLWDGARGNLGIRFPVEPMQERTASPDGPSG